MARSRRRKRGDACLVVRDRQGLYLGVHTMRELKVLAGPEELVSRRDLLYVIENAAYTLAGAETMVHFRPSSNEAPQSSPSRKVVELERHDVLYPPDDCDDRLRRSIDEAIEFIERHRGEKASNRYYGDAADVTHDVYLHGDAPICSVPLRIVWNTFNSGWFLVNDSAVQIVSSLDTKRNQVV